MTIPGTARHGALALLLATTACGSEPVGGDPLPACTPSAILFYSDAYAATVEASGETEYMHVVPGPAVEPVVLDATLAPVDAGDSTFRLTSATGTTDVVAGPVGAATREALPVGTAVRARFENGVVLTDAADGSLLLAVLSAREVAALDAGPFHVEQAAATCATVEYPLPSSSSPCAHGAIETEVLVEADGFEATLSGAAPQTTATIAGRTYSITLVRSVRQATASEIQDQLPGETNVCADAPPRELAVVIAAE